MGATFGTLVILGNSGRTYNIDCSIPDAVATSYTFNATGLSATTSSSTFRIPETGKIINIMLATAPTAVGATVYLNSVPLQGATVRYAGILTTAINQTPMGFPVRQGDLLSLVQW